MKINDIIVDKKNGIGVVTKVTDEKIRVTFDYTINYTYNVYNHQLTIIDPDFIQFINKLYSEQYIENFQIMSEKEIRVHDFSYDNNCFSANLTTYYTSRAFIFKDSKKTFRCTCSARNKCTHVIYLVKYLHDKFIQFSNTSDESKSPSVYQMTCSFCQNFFNFDLFNRLSSVYKTMSFDQTVDYCVLVSNLGALEEIITFLIMMIAQNTPYLQELYDEFNVSQKHIVSTTLNWVINRSNYTKEKNYLLYRAVVLLSDNQMVEWIKEVIDKNKAYLLVNHNYTYNKIFIEIINKTTDISTLYDLNPLGTYGERLDEYYEYLYLYTSSENRQRLIDSKKITKITSSMAPYLSPKDFLYNYELIEKYLEKRVLDVHLEEMLKIDPILTINKIIQPNKYIYASTFNHIKRYASYLPDNKYILKYIDTMTNINRTENIDTIDQIQERFEGEENDE